MRVRESHNVGSAMLGGRQALFLGLTIRSHALFVANPNLTAKLTAAALRKTLYSLSLFSSL